MRHFILVVVFLPALFFSIIFNNEIANSAKKRAGKNRKDLIQKVNHKKNESKIIKKEHMNQNGSGNEDDQDENEDAKLIINIKDKILLFEYERNKSYTKIRELLLKNKYREIEKILQNYSKRYPDGKDRNYYFFWGVVREKNGEYIYAVQSYKKAIEIFPAYSKARNSLGSLYCKLHKYKMAEEQLFEALEANPYNPFINYNIGSLYYDIGNIDKSIKYLRDSIKYKANFGSSYHKLGYIIFNKNNFPLAIEYLQKAIKYNKKRHTTYYLIGLSCLKLEKFGCAVKNFKKAISMKGDFFEAVIELGKIYQSHGEFANALSSFKRAESIDSDHRELKLRLAECLYELRRYTEAIDIVKKLLANKPGDEKLQKFLVSLERKKLLENLDEPDDYYQY